MFAVQLKHVNVLDTVQVHAVAKRGLVAAYEDRRRIGLGHYADTSTIAKYTFLGPTLEQMPGVRIAPVKFPPNGFLVQLGARRCTAAVWVDGIRTPDPLDLSYIRPNEIAAIEVYQPADTPLEFQSSRGTGAGCGAVVVWTKLRFR
jgi:hypothetical protein